MKMQKKASIQSAFHFFTPSRIILFIRKNILIAIILICIGFLGAVVLYRRFISKPTYIYAKVKVGQGYWWATTQMPSQWFLKAIQNGQEQKDITGTSIAKIVNVSYIPYYGTNQYDVYVTTQLKVSRAGKTGAYDFNRETIGIGSPIDLEFSNVQFSGAIVDISEKPIMEQYVSKTVYLTKKSAQTWEFDAINIGDTFMNGNKVLFKVLDKSESLPSTVFMGNYEQLNTVDQTFPLNSETYVYIVLKAKMLLKKDGDKLLFGEEQEISPGKAFGITTSGSSLNGYTITKVE